MELDFNETGHYINQFSLATSQFGFSQQDSQGLYAQWTELFNYACLPAVNGTLNSICSDETCPYANFGDKYPDCGLYQTLQASGIVTAANTARPSDYVPTVSSAATAPPNSGRASTTASTPTPSQLQSTTSTPAAAASSSLGAGEIAGIVIGGGALTFAFILALVFMIKRMNNKSSNSMYNPSLSTTARGTEPPRSYLGHQAVNSWNGPIAEMESKPGSPPPESGHFTIDSGMTERRDARLPGAGG